LSVIGRRQEKFEFRNPNQRMSDYAAYGAGRAIDALMVGRFDERVMNGKRQTV
jgi:hypothetical protein